MENFEGIKVKIRSTKVAMNSGHRYLSYIDDHKYLAVARNRQGGVELYICGPELVAQNKIVQGNMSFGEWQDPEGIRIQANRIEFPHEPYFESVAALVCAEFISALDKLGLGPAFASVEDLIALSFDAGETPSVRSAIGLAGELFLLERLCSADPTRACEYLDSWHGFTHSSRDFSLAANGVEVKTTVRPSSTHRISSISQIEPGNSVHGCFESGLYLLSLGLVWLPPGTPNALTIRKLVAGIEDKLPPQRAEEFINKVTSYGDDALFAYRHNQSQVDELYLREFRIGFTRLYDLLDPQIQLLTSKDLANFQHVRLDSVAYEVCFPEHVRGDVNPIHDVSSIVSVLCEHD